MRDLSEFNPVELRAVGRMALALVDHADLIGPELAGHLAVLRADILRVLGDIEPPQLTPKGVYDPGDAWMFTESEETAGQSDNTSPLMLPRHTNA